MYEELLLALSVADIKEESSVQIWGVGNPLLGDDAVGGYIALRLAGIDCATAPENYIVKLRKQPPESLFIFDAADLGIEPGSVKVLGFDEIGGVAFTSHGLPLKLLLEPFSKTIKIYFIVIQPKTLELGESLSPEVARAAEFIIQKFSEILSLGSSDNSYGTNIVN